MNRTKIKLLFLKFFEIEAEKCSKIKSSNKETGDSVAVIKNYSQKQLKNIVDQHLRNAKHRIVKTMPTEHE